MADKSYREMSDDELTAAHRSWSAKVASAGAWGAGLVFAAEQRDAAYSHIQLRGLEA